MWLFLWGGVFTKPLHSLTQGWKWLMHHLLSNIAIEMDLLGWWLIIGLLGHRVYFYKCMDLFVVGQTSSVHWCLPRTNIDGCLQCIDFNDCLLHTVFKDFFLRTNFNNCLSCTDFNDCLPCMDFNNYLPCTDFNDWLSHIDFKRFMDALLVHVGGFIRLASIVMGILKDRCYSKGALTQLHC